MTGRKYCDSILETASGPDSVERIPRDELLIMKILCFLTALWMLVIAPEVFEMRLPPPLELPDCGVKPGDPIT